MTFYADLPGRRARQVTGDLLVLAWVVLCVLVGRWVHGTVSSLTGPGRALESAGTSLRGRFADVAASIAGVPGVGDDLRGPFDSAADAAGSMSRAGVGVQALVADLASVAGITTAAIPIVLVGAAWLTLRLRFARRATEARRLLGVPGSDDLLALRALARQPTAVVTGVDPDPVGAWRRGDGDVVARLADLELAGSGVLRTPR